MRKINELPEIVNLADDDWILGMDTSANITGKIKISTLKGYIGAQSTPSQSTPSSEYLNGSLLWLEGSLADKSGNNRNPTPVSANSPTIISSALGGRPALRWAGTSNQEIQVTPFLAETTGATLYCVFTVLANTHYNLIRTRNLDDYWRFTNDGNGYFGTFLFGRVDGYPSAMPNSGSHLVSIHATGTSYEVLLNNQSKGVVSRSYTPGDRFRIGTNDKPFNGDISLLMVYPYISPTSVQHQNQILAIKQRYPTLAI